MADREPLDDERLTFEQRAQWLYEEMLIGPDFNRHIRHTSMGQVLLCFMRDFIASSEGREPQDVQDEYEAAWHG